MKHNRAANGLIMKKTTEPDENDDLLPEYRLDYGRAKANRFAVSEQERVVILDPDVTQASEGDEWVLQTHIDAVPATPQTYNSCQMSNDQAI